MKNLIIRILPFIEWLFLPAIFISGVVLKMYRRIGSNNLRQSTNILKQIGVFPIRDHYYEPLFNDRHLKRNLRQPRELSGIDFNENAQLELLKQLKYQVDFNDFVSHEKDKPDIYAFRLENDSFCSGDAEFLFNFIRYFKPKKIIEVGCGTSTKIIQSAISLNEKEKNIICNHVCIEPYEQPWLENFPKIKLLREKIENLDLNLFRDLQSNDLLFIDSSHMIRPQGDVLHEYLSIIPNLQKGVFVHVHDIFTPYDYLDLWVRDQVRFWNEQYLLEALLTGSNKFEVIAALNFLKHKHYNKLREVCPYLSKDREPGSFYFRIK